MKNLLLTGFLLLHAAMTPAAGAAIDVGQGKQLFIDSRMIGRSEGIELRMNPAQKLGPIEFDDGKPLVDHVSRVFEDGGKIRLYVGHEGLTLLESDDAIHFRRAGVSIPGGILPTIFLDPHEADPGRRYKLFRVEAKPAVRPGDRWRVRQLFGRRHALHARPAACCRSLSTIRP